MLVSRRSINDVIRAQQQRIGNGEVEGLRGLAIDHQLELGRLLDSEVRGLGTLEDPVNIYRDLVNDIRGIPTVGHQTAFLGKPPRERYRRQTVFQRQLGSTFGWETR